MRRLYLPGHRKVWIPVAWTRWDLDGTQYAIMDGTLFERPSSNHLWRESVSPIAMVT